MRILYIKFINIKKIFFKYKISITCYLISIIAISIIFKNIAPYLVIPTSWLVPYRILKKDFVVPVLMAHYIASIPMFGGIKELKFFYENKDSSNSKKAILFALKAKRQVLMIIFLLGIVFGSYMIKYYFSICIKANGLTSKAYIKATICSLAYFLSYFSAFFRSKKFDTVTFFNQL